MASRYRARTGKPGAKMISQLKRMLEDMREELAGFMFGEEYVSETTWEDVRNFVFHNDLTGRFYYMGAPKKRWAQVKARVTMEDELPDQWLLIDDLGYRYIRPGFGLRRRPWQT